MRHRRVRIAWLIAIVCAVIAGAAAPAAAHTQLVTSAPGDTATVAEPIGAVVLRFDHPPQEPLAASSTITVTAPSGEEVGGETTMGVTETLPEPIPVLVQEDDEWVQDYHFNAYPVRTPLTSLPDTGTYTVNYTVTDSDGHPAEGSFTFDYEGPTGAVPASAPDPEPGETLVPTVSAEQAAQEDQVPNEAATSGSAAADATSPETAPEPEQAASSSVLAWVILVAAVAVVGAGGWLLWRRRTARAAATTNASARRRDRTARRTRAAGARGPRRSPSAKRPR